MLGIVAVMRLGLVTEATIQLMVADGLLDAANWLAVVENEVVHIPVAFLEKHAPSRFARLNA